MEWGGVRIRDRGRRAARAAHRLCALPPGTGRASGSVDPGRIASSWNRRYARPSAWPLVIVGMFFAIGLILVEAPAPMLIAVGMYLPFYSTAAIFVGGLIHWGFTRGLDRRNASEKQRTAATNQGILLSSGFIAGESLMAVLLAFLYMGSDFMPAVGRLKEALTPSGEPSFVLGLLIYPVVIGLLAWLPLREITRSAAQR